MRMSKPALFFMGNQIFFFAHALDKTEKKCLSLKIILFDKILCKIKIAIFIN